MSLSRKYRPRTFADITDQQTIKDTLRKEVASGTLGHAYLFSGPRGVGKTTTARIFAKALNCLKPKDGEPCNACELCTDANDGRMLDFIEMDAASNTGVDNVREAIVEHVRFAPSRGKFKIYILDEAHMLSTSAWNAMLKTLEEPPPYAIFILATTELHKVPATIVSRCQRFDFRRIAGDALAERIERLAKDEGVKIAKPVVISIVRHADGSVRDAETLLGQLLALGEKNITEDVAALVIPISRLPLAAKILDACATRDLAPALAAVAGLEDEGIPIVPMFDDLIQASRQLLLASADPKKTTELKAGDEGEKRLAETIGKFSAEELGDISLLFMERRRDAKQGTDARFALELAVTAIALGMLPHAPASSVRRDAAPRDDEPPSAPPAAPRAPAPEKKKTADGPLTLAVVQRKWAPFIKALGEKNASLTFILTTSRPVDVSGSTVTIRFQYAFHRDKIVGDLKNRRIVEDQMRDLLGVPELHFEAIVGEDAVVAEKRSEDMVTNILKAFGGQVVEEAGEP